MRFLKNDGYRGITIGKCKRPHSKLIRWCNGKKSNTSLCQQWQEPHSHLGPPRHYTNSTTTTLPSSANSNPIASPPPSPPPSQSSLEVLGRARGRFLPPLEAGPVAALQPFPSPRLEPPRPDYFRRVLPLRPRCQAPPPVPPHHGDDGSVALDWVTGDDRTLLPDSPLWFVRLKLSFVSFFFGVYLMLCLVAEKMVGNRGKEGEKWETLKSTAYY